MIDASFVESIVELAESKVVTIDGKEYSTQIVYEAPKPDKPEIVKVYGLTALVNMVSLEGTRAVAVQVRSEREVVILAARDEFGRVPVLCMGIASLPEIKMLDQKVSAERAIIELNATFAPTEERDQALKFLSGLQAESSVRLEDDGTAQSTVVKKGVAGLDRVAAKPLRILAPYLTFPEIEPIETSFLLRLHSQENNVPLVSLTWADNGNYERTAMDRIRKFLSEKVSLPIV